MKQYIKKALWIIPFLYSLNLSAAYFYYIGSIPTNKAHWNTSKTATSTTASATRPTNSQFFTSGNTFDFNGKNTNLAGIMTSDAKLVNTGSSCTLTVSSGTFTIVDLDFSLNLTLTNLNIDFSTTGGVVKYSGSGIQTIYPTTYANLSLDGLSGSALHSSGTITITETIALEGNILQNNSTFSLALGSQISSGNSLTYGIFNNNGTFTDNRSTVNQIHYWGYEHLVASDLPKGTFSSFCKVSASCTLSGNTTFNSLTVGRTTGAQILSCSTFQLEIKSNPTFAIKTSTSDTSGINCSNGTLKISRNASATYYTCYFRSSTAAGGARSDIANLIINNSTLTVITLSTYDNSSSVYDYQMPTITNDCSITKGSLKLDGGILKVNGNYNVSSSDGIILDVTDPLTDNLDLNQTNSTLNITSNASTVTYTSGHILNQTIKNLVLNFNGGGVFELPESIEITGDLDIYDDQNYLEIGPNTLNLTGSLSYSSGTGGYIIGGSSSKLSCALPDASVIYMDQTTSGTSNLLSELKINNSNTLVMGKNLVVSDLNLASGKLAINDQSLSITNSLTRTTGSLIGSLASDLTCEKSTYLYFDQTSTSNQSLENLILLNSSSCTLGSNLILTGELNLGTGTLTTGSNTLTFSGTSTQPITRGTGTINTTTGNVKYAQTSTNGDNILLTAAYSPNINNLSLDFNNGGKLTPDGSMTIGGTITMSTANNYFNINGTALTLTGSVINTNGTSGGKFTGSTSSKLYCQSTSTLYFDQTSSSNKTLKELKIQGNSVTITLGNPLTITGGTSSSSYGSIEIPAASSTLNTGNNLTLESNAYGTARIANSPGSISGRYYAEQYFPATREFRFIGVPVVGATALQWRNNGDNSTSNRGIQITGSSTSSDSFDISSLNKPSAWYFSEPDAGDITDVDTISTLTDDPGWKKITKGGNTYALPNGRGFRVLVRGDRKTSLTSTPTLSSTTIWTYGTYPTRNANNAVEIGVSNSGTNKINEGLNLISNPYPSAINWNAIGRSTKVDNGYVLYRPATASKSGQFVAWNGFLGDAGQYISANQAFFVYCNTDNDTGTLLFYENAKHDGVGGSFFSEKISNHMRINLLYDTTYNSNAYLHFANWGLSTKDAFDVPQFQNNGTNVATMDMMGNKYNINTLPLFDTMTIVPLSVAGTPEAKLKLSFHDLTSFDNTAVTLTDNYLKKTIDINEGSIYSFEITNDSMSSKNGRFYLNFRKNNTAKTLLIEENIANIYPIPVKDDLTVELNTKFKNAEFIISNSIGQQINKGNISREKNTIITKNLESGIYLIKIKSSNSVQTIKFIK